MKKILITLALASSLSIAGLINGVAITVNNQPISLYDIEKVKDRFQYDDRKAAELLLRKIIMEEEILKNYPDFNIKDEIFTEITARASRLNYTYDELREKLIEKGFNWDDYRDDIKTELIKIKFDQMVIDKRMVKIPTKEETLGYYNTHEEYFTKAKVVKLIEYTSNSEESLEYVKNNPMANVGNVQKREREIVLEDNPALANILNEVKEGEFTQNIKVSRDSNEFISLFVLKKSGIEKMSFKDAENKIKDILFVQKRKKAVEDFIQKLKSEADINVLR
jgi:hypothetical protein